MKIELRGRDHDPLTVSLCARGGRWNTWSPVINGYIEVCSLPITPFAYKFQTAIFTLPVLMYFKFSAPRCEFLLHSRGREFVNSVQTTFSGTLLAPVSHEHFACSGLGLVHGRVLNTGFSFCIIFRDIPGTRMSKIPLPPKVSAVIPWCLIFWWMWCSLSFTSPPQLLCPL